MASDQLNGKLYSTKVEQEIEILSKNADTLFHLSDSELLNISKELLETFITKAELWSQTGGWSDIEMELCGKKGFARGAAAVRLRTALSIGNCFRSLVQYYEYKIHPNSARKKPALLRNIQEVGDKRVYGPVSAGLLGGQFELWTRPKEISETKISSGVTLVLGAGNQSMVTALDALHSIFNTRKTTLIKHHPLRPWLLAPYSILFEPLIKRGFLAQVLDEGIHASKKLVSNPLISHVHITGSLRSFIAIKETLRSTRPHQTKEEIDAMLTGELGCVSPWIINPGKYTAREMGHMTCSIIASKKNYGGANCVAGQVILLPKHWDQKNEFWTAVEKEFSRQPDSAAYYPCSVKRKTEIVSAYEPDQVRVMRARCGQGNISLNEGDLVALIECGSPGNDLFRDKALKTEAFGPVLAVVELDYDKEKEDDYLLDIAIPYVNDKSNIFGCLSCNLLSPPSTLKSKKIRKAIETLNYGMIGVNEWIALAILPVAMGGIWGPWGLDKTGDSGKGFVGNLFGIPHVEKMVVSRNLNLPPAFDELAQPPMMVINNLGFLWATRPSNHIILFLRGALIVLEALITNLLLKINEKIKLMTTRIGVKPRKFH